MGGRLAQEASNRLVKEGQTQEAEGKVWWSPEKEGEEAFYLSRQAYQLAEHEEEVG